MMYESPFEPVGCAVCNAIKVGYEPRIVTDVPSLPVAPVGPVTP